MSSEHAGPRWTVTVIAFVLWMLSLLLGLYAIYSFQESAIAIYALLGGRDQYVAGLMRWVVVAIGAVLWIGIMVVGGEYHLKHPGEPKSWKIFAWTFGVEIVLILAGLLL